MFSLLVVKLKNQFQHQFFKQFYSFLSWWKAPGRLLHRACLMKSCDIDNNQCNFSPFFTTLTHPCLCISVSDHHKAAGGGSHRHALQENLPSGPETGKHPDPNHLWGSSSADHRFWMWRRCWKRPLQLLHWYGSAPALHSSVDLWSDGFHWHLSLFLIHCLRISCIQEPLSLLLQSFI